MGGTCLGTAGLLCGHRARLPSVPSCHAVSSGPDTLLLPQQLCTWSELREWEQERKRDGAGGWEGSREEKGSPWRLQWKAEERRVCVDGGQGLQAQQGGTLALPTLTGPQNSDPVLRGGHIGSPLRPGSHSACEILVSAKHPHISRASPQGQVAKNCFLSPKAGGLPAVPVGRGTAGCG